MNLNEEHDQDHVEAINYEMRAPIDKRTRNIVKMNVCLKSEVHDPNRQVYKIEGFIIKDGVKKVALKSTTVNLLVSEDKLYSNYIKNPEAWQTINNVR